MYLPLQLNQVCSPHDYVSVMDHFGKLMELITNISMAVLAETCRLVDTTQIKTIVDQN